MKEDIKLLKQIPSVGEYTAKLILSYCGSLENCLKPNSYLSKAAIPGISRDRSYYILSQLLHILPEPIPRNERRGGSAGPFGGPMAAGGYYSNETIDEDEIM